MAESDGSIVIDTEINSDGMQAGSNELMQAIKTLQSELQSLGQTIKDTFGQTIKVTTDTSESEQKIADLEQKIKELEAAMDKLKQADTGGGTSPTPAPTPTPTPTTAVPDDYTKLSEELTRARAQMESLSSSGKKGESVIKKLAHAAMSAAKWCGQMALGLLKLPVNLISKAAAGIKDIITRGKNGGEGFKGLIGGAKAFTGAMLAANGIYAILQKAAQTYMQQNTQVANSLAACWSGIGNIIGPIIERIVNLVATVISYLTQFLSLLGIVGKKSSKAIGKAAGAAGGAAAELKKQLMSFDELNIMQNQDSGGGGGGGGGASVAALPDVTTNDWFETLKKQFEEGDWHEVGMMIGGKVNDALTKVTHLIDWNNIGSTITQYIDMVTGIINGLFDGVNWEGLGATFGTGVNTFVNTVNGLFAGIDWSKIGTAISDSLNGLIQKVDWGHMGTMLYNIFSSKLKVLSAAITRFDWTAAGKSLGEFITGIFQDVDWLSIGDTVANGVNGALEFITTAVNTVPWDEIATGFFTSFTHMIATINWEGIGDLVATLFNGAVNFIYKGLENFDAVAAGEALFAKISGFIAKIDWAGLGQLIGEFFKSALGFIHGAIEGINWEEVGQKIQDFLTNIDWHGVFTALAEVVKAALLAAIELIVNAVPGLKTLLEQAGLWSESGGAAQAKDVADGYAEVVNTSLDDILDSISEFNNTAKKESKSGAQAFFGIVGNAFTKTADTAETTSESITLSVEDVADTIVDNLTGATEAATEEVSKMNSIVTRQASDMSDKSTAKMQKMQREYNLGFKVICDTGTLKMNQMLMVAESSFTGMKTSGNTNLENLKTTISNGFTSIANTVSSKMGEATSVISGTSWSSLGSNLVSGLKNGITNAWGTVTNTLSNLASGLTNGLKNLFGIHSPSRVWRDEIGLYLGLGLGEGIERSQNSVMQSAEEVVDATAQKLAHKDLYIGNIIPVAEFDLALASFGDKVANSFSSLIDRLNNIANGIVPYKIEASTGATRSTSEAIEASNDELGSVVAQVVSQAAAAIVRAIEDNGNGGSVTLDRNDITNSVINEINRRTRVTGTSPLLI